jgi:hypothetical protein
MTSLHGLLQEPEGSVEVTGPRGEAALPVKGLPPPVGEAPSLTFEERQRVTVPAGRMEPEDLLSKMRETQVVHGMDLRPRSVTVLT